MKEEGIRVKEGGRVKDRDGEISSTTRAGDRRAADSSYSKNCSFVLYSNNK